MLITLPLEVAFVCLLVSNGEQHPDSPVTPSNTPCQIQIGPMLYKPLKALHRKR